jgi:hypothetical protein
MPEETAGVMPVGQYISLPIRAVQVETAEGNVAAPVYTADAVATLVWQNYQQARNYVENNAWLLDWQEADILYQSPTPDRFIRVQQGRPTRVPRFLVAKFKTTLARAVKRGLFAEQYPFFLRPSGKTTQVEVDAWSDLIGKLLKRMKFKYHAGLQIDCQVLQGTGIGKAGWEERTVTKKTRKRKQQPIRAEMPMGAPKEIPTKESDEFETVETTVTESWPFYEYRRIGTTLFDPKWCTPNAPDESAGYCIDVDYVNFADLQEMRKLDCYQNIPKEEILKAFFFNRQAGSAPTGSSVEDTMTSQGSMAAHAEGRNRQTDASPLEQPLLLLEQWDMRTVKTVLCYDGRMLTIRNEEHDYESLLHFSANWWNIDNSGYGMGIGKINGADQRINQGVINECLKMIAYPMNAPLLVGRGINSPTQNVLARLGGFWQVDSDDVRKGVGFMEMPQVPKDAWSMLEYSQKSGEDISGASPQMQQGNIGGPGSSVARTATGVNRVGAASDQNVADPIDAMAEGVIVPVIQFLVRMVKLKMPLKEIREMLSEKHAAVIESAIAQDQFLDAQFEVEVLAGAKLAARAGIQQLIPLFLQMVQQPQLLEYLHQRGETIDFAVIVDLFMQVAELTQQPDIIRPLTPEEKQMLGQMNPGMQRVKAVVAQEQAKGANKLREIQTQGQVDLGNKAAEVVMQHAADGVPLERAAGLVERAADVDALKNGLPDTLQ